MEISVTYHRSHKTFIGSPFILQIKDPRVSRITFKYKLSNQLHKYTLNGWNQGCLYCSFGLQENKLRMHILSNTVRLSLGNILIEFCDRLADLNLIFACNVSLVKSFLGDKQCHPNMLSHTVVVKMITPRVVWKSHLHCGQGSPFQSKDGLWAFTGGFLLVFEMYFMHPSYCLYQFQQHFLMCFGDQKSKAYQQPLQ